MSGLHIDQLVFHIFCDIFDLLVNIDGGGTHRQQGNGSECENQNGNQHFNQAFTCFAAKFFKNVFHVQTPPFEMAGRRQVTSVMLETTSLE